MSVILFNLRQEEEERGEERREEGMRNNPTTALSAVYCIYVLCGIQRQLTQYHVSKPSNRSVLTSPYLSSVSFSFVVHRPVLSPTGNLQQNQRQSSVVVKLDLRVAGRLNEIQLGCFAKDAPALRQCSVNPEDW